MEENLIVSIQNDTLNLGDDFKATLERFYNVDGFELI